MTLHRVQIGRRPGAWVVRTPEGRHLLAGESEAWLLSLMDGSRALTDLAREVRAPPPDAARVVAGLIARLAGFGVLEGDEGRWNPPPAPGRRVALGDPTRLLEPVCALLRRLPSQTARALAGALLACGLLGALLHGERLAASLSWVALWQRLPATIALAWGLGVVHEAAHAGAAVLYGGRVRTVGIGLTRWRVGFYVDIPDLILLPRAVRIRVAAAGPLADGALAAGVILATWLWPALREGGIPLAAAALLRVAWNLLPALWTDGAYLLSELAGMPGMEREARRALAALWPSRRAARRARRAPAGLPLILYGLLSVVLEGALVLLLGLRAVQAVRGP